MIKGVKMKALVDIIKALLTLPIGTNLSILLVGIIIGSYLRKSEAQSTADQFIQYYVNQKEDMWVEFKKLRTGV